jgi:hypothetical protein
LAFLRWAGVNTDAELTAFTNGSVLNEELLLSLNRKITLVFSMDAIGRPAEYVRFGTVWPTVSKNFNLAKSLPNVVVRVNITTSVYNFYYFPDLIDMLLPDWPSVVTFGPALEDIYSEKVIPLHLRTAIILRLEDCLMKINSANIEEDQKTNAFNAVNSIRNNLKTLPYDSVLHAEFKEFVSKMDSVKKVNLTDYCPEIADYLI